MDATSNEGGKPIIEEIEKKSVAALYILEAEMKVHLSSKVTFLKEHWDTTLDYVRDEGLLTEEEHSTLKKTHRGHVDVESGWRSTMIWSWIGMVTSKVRNEPGVLVPMYVRLVYTSQGCLNIIDQLRTSVQVQIPFTYAYLLSVIVHINNILLAVCTGFQIGATFSGMQLSKPGAQETPQQKLDFYKSAELLIMQTMILVIQPLMYQACLVIAHILNHPFGDQVFHLPTEMYIVMLRDELKTLHRSFHDHALEKDDKTQHSDSDNSHDSAGDDDDDDDDDGD